MPGCLLLFYIFSFSDSTVLLVDRVSTFVLNKSLDFPCEGHGCGCTTALKCLTNCCCDKKALKAKKAQLYICGTPEKREEVKSCCDTESEKDKDSCNEVKEPRPSFVTACSIKRSTCGFNLEDALFKQQKPQILNVTNFEYLAPLEADAEPIAFEPHFTPKDVCLKIEKVPIFS